MDIADLFNLDPRETLTFIDSLVDTHETWMIGVISQDNIVDASSRSWNETSLFGVETLYFNYARISLDSPSWSARLWWLRKQCCSDLCGLNVGSTRLIPVWKRRTFFHAVHILRCKNRTFPENQANEERRGDFIRWCDSLGSIRLKGSSWSLLAQFWPRIIESTVDALKTLILLHFGIRFYASICNLNHLKFIF